VKLCFCASYDGLLYDPWAVIPRRQKLKAIWEEVTSLTDGDEGLKQGDLQFEPFLRNGFGRILEGKRLQYAMCPCTELMP
jgi:hypothetical protein